MIKKIFIIFVFVVYTWCCEDGYLNIDGNCYFNGDIKFLKELIENSQGGKRPPFEGMLPIDLGWQHWEDGRLVEFCCSTSTNTECRMTYELSGPLPLSIKNLTAVRVISMTSNSLTGVLPVEIGYLKKLEELSLASNKMSGKIPKEIG